METKDSKQSVTFSCSAKEAYHAWLDSKTHADMVNGNAKIDPKVDGAFSIWDDTITGKTLELHPHDHRIVQSWRYEYDKWPVSHFSKITLEFKDEKEGQCKLYFWQTDVPAQYAEEISQGWKD